MRPISYKYLYFLLCVLLSSYCFCQQDDKNNLISVDFLPIINSTNTQYGGLLYKHFFSNNNFATRAGLNAQYSNYNTYIKDTLNSNTTSLVITSKVGIEYIKKVTDIFSVSFGSDVFLTTTYDNSSSYNHSSTSGAYYNYGALPFICFSFTVYKQFYICTESRCIVNIITQNNPLNSSTNSKDVSIRLFNDYSVFLGYKF